MDTFTHAFRWAKHQYIHWFMNQNNQTYLLFWEGWVYLLEYPEHLMRASSGPITLDQQQCPPLAPPIPRLSLVQLKIISFTTYLTLSHPDKEPRARLCGRWPGRISFWPYLHGSRYHKAYLTKSPTWHIYVQHIVWAVILSGTETLSHWTSLSFNH